MYNSRNSQSKQIKLHTAAADTYTRRGGWVLGSTHIKSPVSFAQFRKIQGIAQPAIKVRDTLQS